MQNRALKVSGTRESVKKTYYFRDAQGNVLATYTLKNDVLTLEEIDIYGSSRLGLLKPNLQMYPSVSVENKDFEGKKNYELSNHLGNVLAVISDRKKGMGSSSGNYAYFDAVTISATDYFPFGMAMPGRTFNTEGYKFGFNGKENDSEWAKQDYGMRISDPRIARFLSIDPLTAQYPFYSPYQFAGNMPIWAIDLDGLEPAFTNGGAEARENNLRTPESRNKQVYDGGLMKEVEIKAQRVAGTPETWKRTNVRSLATGDISYNVDGVNIVQRNAITGSQYYATYKDAPTVKIWDDAEKRQQYWNNLVGAHEAIGYGSASLCMEALTMGGGGIGRRTTTLSRGSKAFSNASNTLLKVAKLEVRVAEAASETAELSSLNPTHFITDSKSKMKNFVQEIKTDGAIKESILYVEHGGSKFIVDGHHRFFCSSKIRHNYCSC